MHATEALLHLAIDQLIVVEDDSQLIPPIMPMVFMRRKLAGRACGRNHHICMTGLQVGPSFPSTRRMSRPSANGLARCNLTPI